MLNLVQFLLPSCETPNVPKDGSERLWLATVRYNFWYSIVALFVGVGLALAGVFLFVAGIAVGTNWFVSLFGMKSELTDAPAGAVIAVVGLIVIFLTRFSAKSE